MRFWTYMLIMDLLVPVVLIVIGARWKENPPKEINRLHGYRTSMSMKNKDTWETAHKIYARVSYILGLLMFVPTVSAMWKVITATEDEISMRGNVIAIVQLVVLVLEIIYTEIRMRMLFDKNGNRRNQPKLQ